MQLTPLEWLEREKKSAANYYGETATDGDTLESEYWRGYKHAITNAIAAVFGPTDLDEEATE